jgi:pyruvate,water dikinase
METMMGVKQGLNPELIQLFDFLKNPPRYPLWHRMKLLILTAYRLVRSKKYVDEFMALIEGIYAPLQKVDFTRMSLPEQLALYRELEESVLKRWTAPIVNDTRCMLAFGLLKTLTTTWLGADNESLQNDLVCGEGDLKSTEPTKLLMKIAKVVDLGPADLRERFLKESADEIWQSLRTGFAPQIYGLFQDFLERYGFRCLNELKLEEPDLNDDPSVVIASVQSYVRMKSYPVERMELSEAAIRKNAEEKVRTLLSPLRLFIYNRVLRWARRAVRDRELLRFERTRTFGVTRRLFRGMGCNFVRLGILSDERDVFYLTLEEIISFQEGRTVLTDFKKLVLLRREEFLAYANNPAPPDRLLTRGAVGSSLAYPGFLVENDLLIAENAADPDPSIFRGTPCSPGVVEGAIRVVHCYKDAEGLNGEILVTERTDPGWVPLFPSCSGLIIERGSLLSHSAVVARELGIPTIVGVNGKPMQRLQTGQRVRMDAGKGEVRIL